MTAARTSAQDQPGAPEAAPSARRCLVTGETRPKDELIRFAIAPDHTVVPDLAGNLPGRGLWVTASRADIETAARKNLFAKAAKEKIKADPDLADAVARLLRRRCLQLLGLACGAGIAILGQPQVEAAAKSGKLALLLIADDAAACGLAKVVGTSAAEEAVRCFTRGELGAALGQDQLVYAGLGPHGLTAKLQAELARLAKIAGKGHISGETECGNS